MATPQEVIARWRSRFRDETVVESRGVPRRWFAARMRRVYQFLLNRYGDGRWNTRPVDSGERIEKAYADFGTFGGKPAKSTADVSRKLKAIHLGNSGNITPATPPRSAGIGKCDWITAGEFRLFAQVLKFRRQLRRGGIPSQHERRGGKFFVLVQHRDLDQAVGIRNEIREQDNLDKQATALESPEKANWRRLSWLAIALFVCGVATWVNQVFAVHQLLLQIIIVIAAAGVAAGFHLCISRFWSSGGDDQ